MTRRRLTDEQLQEAMASLPTWSVVGGKLHRELEFTNFVEAFGFMAQVALIAESMDHHPDWSNVYNRVVIDLNTHDLGGLSELDTTLATRIEALVAG